ncbi:putative N-acetyltransferase ycf52 [Porphyridium purpureum]|uniref:Putative N-acetyltransferase ycf52 n=1 Tax=Porphyridium purpureum TaxID=35688 RepID=A0A5J4YU49_PORPP|nr:putative N-acetyltransferase ycf52 [Porphyridium purpureum]|eukprot:POR4532..scf227_4
MAAYVVWSGAESGGRAWASGRVYECQQCEARLARRKRRGAEGAQRAGLSAQPRRARKCRMTAQENANEAAMERPNVGKLKSQRCVVSSRKSDVTPEEINGLFERAGKKPRDPERWKIAIKHSYCVVSAKLFSDGSLAGFARATSDMSLNATIWDVVVDPALPNPAALQQNVVSYLLREIRSGLPGCSVALISPEKDIALFQKLDFVPDPDGITAMVLNIDPNIPPGEFLL